MEAKALCGRNLSRRIDGDLEDDGIDNVSLEWIANVGGGQTFVSKSQKELPVKLYDKINEQNCNNLLMEYNDIHQKRISLEKSISELTTAKKLIEDIM